MVNLMGKLTNPFHWLTQLYISLKNKVLNFWHLSALPKLCLNLAIMFGLLVKSSQKIDFICKFQLFSLLKINATSLLN